MINTIYKRLKTYPGLELLQTQQVDAVPGGSGLFFRGVTEKARRYDLLGGIQCQNRYLLRLSRYDDGGDSPIFFLLLGAWIQANQQSLGASTTAALENARCVRASEQGIPLWEADLEVTCWEEQ